MVSVPASTPAGMYGKYAGSPYGSGVRNYGGGGYGVPASEGNGSPGVRLGRRRDGHGAVGRHRGAGRSAITRAGRCAVAGRGDRGRESGCPGRSSDAASGGGGRADP